MLPLPRVTERLLIFGALLRFLLKSIEHIDNVFELNGVDGPISVTCESFHDLQDSGAAKAFDRLGIGVLPALRVPLARCRRRLRQPVQLAPEAIFLPDSARIPSLNHSLYMSPASGDCRDRPDICLQLPEASEVDSATERLL